MKFTIAQTDLAHALRVTARAVGSGKAHPILTGVELTATTGSVRVRAYDLEVGVTASIPATVQAAGATVVPHRLLSDLISRLDASQALSMTLDGSRIAIDATAGSYSLSVASAEDFPDLPAVDAAAGAPIDLSGLLAGMLPVVSTDASKQILCGVHVVADGATLRMEATDGHRLALRSIPCTAAPLDLVIPAKTLAMVRQPATLATDNRHAVFGLADGTEVLSTVLSGTYPNARQLVPDSFKHTAACDRQALISGLERIAVIADSHNSVVKLTLANGAIQIQSETDASSGSESIAADGTMPPLAANVHYLLDGLKHLVGTEVTISANSSTTPVVIAAAGNDDNIYLVMPIQIRS
jgi:DNA polymerase-3 subunit beta